MHALNPNFLTAVWSMNMETAFSSGQDELNLIYKKIKQTKERGNEEEKNINERDQG